MGNAFWLGIIGGIFGILAVVLVVQLGGMGEAFNAVGGLQPYTNAAGAALIFSLVGIAGGVPRKPENPRRSSNDYRSARGTDIDQCFKRS